MNKVAIHEIQMPRGHAQPLRMAGVEIQHDRVGQLNRSCKRKYNGESARNVGLQNREALSLPYVREGRDRWS